MTSAANRTKRIPHQCTVRCTVNCPHQLTFYAAEITYGVGIYMCFECQIVWIESKDQKILFKTDQKFNRFS